MFYSDRPSKMVNMSQTFVITLPKRSVPGFCLKATNYVISYFIRAIDTCE